MAPPGGKAEKAGLKVAEIAEAVKAGDVVMMLLPDEQIADVYQREVAPTSAKAPAGLCPRLQRALRPSRAPRRPDVGWSPPRPPLATPCAAPTPRGGVPHLVARSTQDKPGKARDLALSYAAATAAARPASSRPPSVTRPRPTCSASKPCCAAAPSS